MSIAENGSTRQSSDKKNRASEARDPSPAWKKISSELTAFRTISSLAKSTGLPEDSVSKTIDDNKKYIRRSIVNAKSGEALYIRRDTGIRPIIREIVSLIRISL